MQLKNLWKNDFILSQINITNIKMVSFDIFDTLVLRKTVEPKDIFLQVADAAINRDVLKSHISLIEFRELRIVAEQKARKKKIAEKGHREITLLDIYSEFPNYLCDREKMIDIELEVEKSMIYLNDNVYSFLKYCKSKKLRIALLSDMYLSSNQIKEILSNAGADLTLFDEIIVSSENGTSKSVKGLYNVLFNRFENVDKKEIIHIGDNYISDFKNANEFGIQAIHYVLDRFRDEKYQLETVKKDRCIGEFFSLRKQMSFSNKYTNPKEGFWYDFGATVLGPIFSVFMDEVISIANQEKIKNLYPIMRDGYIFEKMLGIYSEKNKEVDLNIKPIYASRLSTHTASFSEFDQTILKEYINSSQLTVDSVFNRFSISDHPFEEYNDHTISSMKSMIYPNGNKVTIYEEIVKYFLSNEIKTQVNKAIKEDRELLVDYLGQNIDVSERFLTIDVGYNGTIAESIEKAFRLKGKNLKAMHLFMISQKKLVEKMLDGMNNRAFIKCQYNSDFLNSDYFNPLLIESFMSGNFGSVLGYERRMNGEVFPVLDDSFIEQRNKRQIDICQNGILDYYTNHLDFYKRTKTDNNRLCSDKVMWIVERFMKYPTRTEATYLGELYTENNFRFKSLKKLCTKEEEKKARNLGATKYLRSKKEKENIWPAGVVERVFPFYSALKLYEKSSDSTIRAMSQIVDYILNEGIGQCIVYGAGEMGRSLVNMLLACQVKIISIVDRDEKLWGDKIEGIEIISFSQSKLLDSNIYVIASQAYVDEINRFIEENYYPEKEVVVINYKSGF